MIGCSENAHDFLRASITVRTADLLFDWFGFSSFSYIEINKRFNCGHFQNVKTGGQPYVVSGPALDRCNGRVFASHPTIVRSRVRIP